MSTRKPRTCGRGKQKRQNSISCSGPKCRWVHTPVWTGQVLDNSNHMMSSGTRSAADWKCERSRWSDACVTGQGVAHLQRMKPFPVHKQREHPHEQRAASIDSGPRRPAQLLRHLCRLHCSLTPSRSDVSLSQRRWPAFGVLADRNMLSLMRGRGTSRGVQAPDDSGLAKQA